MYANHPSAFNVYISNGRPKTGWKPGRAAEAAMKRRALCDRKPGFGVGFRMYGTAVGGLIFGFVRLIAKLFMRLRERPPKIAGIPSSLAAIRGAE
jgi:hypothetical protein